jgi:hypothetical protein
LPFRSTAEIEVNVQGNDPCVAVHGVVAVQNAARGWVAGQRDG